MQRLTTDKDREIRNDVKDLKGKDEETLTDADIKRLVVAIAKKLNLI